MLGWIYWFKCIILSPNQMAVDSLATTYWIDTNRVNVGVWITIFLVLIISINYFDITFFGEFKSRFSSFKVAVIIGIILLSIILCSVVAPTVIGKVFNVGRIQVS